MKQKDIALIIVVMFFSGIVSLLVSNLFFASDSERSLTAEVVEPIDSSFQHPDAAFFNERSINPTQLIKIGDSSNKQPF
jgi:hypothetical protein